MHDPHAGAERVVAAFDFDKTISTRDNVMPFLRAVIGRVRLARALLAISPRLVRAALDDDRRDAAKVALVRHTLTGCEAARVTEVAAGFASDVLARHLRPDVVDRVRWHRDQGHEVVIVSASLKDYLDPIASELGVAAVLATELAVGDDGRLTGELTGPNVRGPEKVRRLDAWLGDRPAFVWAYGDSSGDRELLARADRGVTVGRAQQPR
ncbi:MAG TPA: HAD-IB family hydrolase [Acidimicrobiia bacterium]|nr:HAD-IB family hydrolase [Acidimicrobiia bacterium]